METLTQEESLPAQGKYTPPPSQFGTGGFTAFAGRNDPEVASDGAGEDGSGGWFFQTQDSPAQEPTPEPEETLAPWPHGPRPARAVDWSGFDELVLGQDSDQEMPDQRPEYDGMALASMVISLSGLVTGVGFLAGIVMGHITLRLIGRAGWFSSNEPARRRARNAVMIGYIGIAVLVSAVLLVGTWWLMQTPLETLIPDPATIDTASPAATEVAP